MAEITDAPQVVNREGKKLDVVLIEVSNDVNTREIVGTATKLRLRFLVVPVDCGSRVMRDTVRKRGRFSDNHVNGEVCRWAGMRGAEVARCKEQANIGWAGRVVGDQVSGFGGYAVPSGDKVGPGANVRTENVESVTEVGAEGGFT